MEAVITEEKITRLMELWKAAGKGKLSHQKAEKRLRKAAEHGCPLLDECVNCPNVRACPVLRLDDDGAEGGAL